MAGQNAIQKLGIKREDIFLTTKVWVTEFGYEKTKASVEESMRKLKTDYIDLVLIHQCLSDYYGAYHALENMYEEGKIKAIGISNFSAERMADIATFNRIVPAVNQVETHMFWQQYELHGWMEKYNIQHEALTKLIVTKDMSERKNKMIELGDAFIAFPGGTGTLEEIAEVMSKVSLKHLDAPCYLQNREN